MAYWLNWKLETKANEIPGFAQIRQEGLQEGLQLGRQGGLPLGRQEGLLQGIEKENHLSFVYSPES